MSNATQDNLPSLPTEPSDEGTETDVGTEVLLPETDEEQAPSPFIEGTHIQFAWDSTSLGYLKTCPRLYQYHMIDGWQGRGEAIHLRFGIEYHQALQDYDLSIAAGIKHEDAIHDVLRALLDRISDWRPDPSTNSEGLKSKENLVRTVIWYLDEFGPKDPAKTVILDNGKPAVELSFTFPLDWGPFGEKKCVGGHDRCTGIADNDCPYCEVAEGQPYLLCGHLDRVVDYLGETYVMDRKTTTSTPGSYYFNQFEPNNQMTLYTLASQVIFGSPVKGVIIDAAQIAVGFSRFTRGITTRTRDQLDEWLDNLKFLFAQAEDYAAEGYWPQNDTACDKYGGCKFREICSKSPQVREQFLKSSFVKGERWNPLKPR